MKPCPLRVKSPSVNSVRMSWSLGCQNEWIPEMSDESKKWVAYLGQAPTVPHTPASEREQVQRAVPSHVKHNYFKILVICIMKFRMDSLHYALLAVVILLAVYVLKPLKKEGNCPTWCRQSIHPNLSLPLQQKCESQGCQGDTSSFGEWANWQSKSFNPRKNQSYYPDEWIRSIN